MDWEIKDVPLSESTVSLRLADVQRRCAELLSEPGALGELTLADDDPPAAVPDRGNPYNRG